MFNKVIEALLALVIGGSLAVSAHGLSVGNEEAAYAFGTLSSRQRHNTFFQEDT